MAAAAENWHAIGAEEALARLGSAPSGLTHAEAGDRLARVGPNALPAGASVHPVQRFLAQFNNTLIYVMLGGAVAAAFLNHAIDAAVILVVVVVNAIVGFIQEGRAEESLKAIRGLIAPHATVLRGGERQTVGVEALVPGDVVLIEAGERVPADLRLLRARGLSIDEAPLTGESVTAAKREAAVAPEAPLGDREGMAFSGTLVTTGQATGVVVATGPQTEIGRISRLLQDVEPMVTPLLRQIDRFARGFTYVILAGAIALFFFAVHARGFAWVDALMAVVALTVGVVPEGLPAVLTITMAIGVRRMAARRAVVRKLPAVETLGVEVVAVSGCGGRPAAPVPGVRYLAEPEPDVFRGRAAAVAVATGDVVALESPTHFSFLEVLQGLHLKALEIPTHPRHGISLDALQLALEVLRGTPTTMKA